MASPQPVIRGDHVDSMQDDYVKRNLIKKRHLVISILPRRSEIYALWPLGWPWTSWFEAEYVTGLASAHKVSLLSSSPPNTQEFRKKSDPWEDKLERIFTPRRSNEALHCSENQNWPYPAPLRGTTVLWVFFKVAWKVWGLPRWC